MEAGDLVRFSDEFKSKIDYNSDYLYYIKDDVFEVADEKDDLIKIKGLGMWGFTKSSQFVKVTSLVKEFIPYQEALDLYRLGFNEECMAYYFSRFGKTNIKFCFGLTPKLQSIKAPTYQQSFKWFRHEYGINFTIDWEFCDGFHYYFKWTTPNGDHGEEGEYQTYEAAEIEGLKRLIVIAEKLSANSDSK